MKQVLGGKSGVQFTHESEVPVRHKNGDYCPSGIYLRIASM